MIEEGGLETLMLKMKQLSGVEEEETTEEELIKQFESVENQSAESKWLSLLCPVSKLL